MAVQIQVRRDTAANWTSADPTLAEGEIGYETDTGRYKVGDGLTAWTSLAYHAAANVAISAANGSTVWGTVTFANSNGVSFSTGTQGVYATVATNYLTTARASNDAVGLNTAQTNVTWTVNSAGISLDAGGYAGTGTSATNASITLNSNGLAVSVNAGGSPAISAGTSSASLNSIVFSNSNGVSFGLNGSTVTASHNGLTSQSNQAYSAANGSVAFQTITFADSNGVSFSTGTQGLYATVKTDYLTTARASNDAIGLNTAQSNVTWTVNSSGLSLDARGYAGTGTSATNASITVNSNGLAISVGAGGGLTNINVSAGTTSNNLSAITFNNGNGITFGLNASTVTASHNGLTSQSNQAFSAAGGSSAFQTLGFSDNAYASWTNTNGSVALTGLRASLFAASNTTQGTSGTQNIDAITFAGAGVASIGITNGSVVVSVPVGGGAGDGYNIVYAGTTNTTGTTWSALSASVRLNGSDNIYVSQNNSNDIVISRQRRNCLDPYRGVPLAVGQIGQGSVYVAPISLHGPMTFDRWAGYIQYTQATNSTLTVTCSVGIGVYTSNANTLSLLTSYTGSFSINGSGTASSAQNSGWRAYSIGASDSLSEGCYWMGFWSRTTTAGANATLSNYVASQLNTVFSGYIGQSVTATRQMKLGMGIYSATSTNLPVSMAYSHITGTGSTQLRPPVFWFTSGSV